MSDADFEDDWEAPLSRELLALPRAEMLREIGRRLAEAIDEANAAVRNVARVRRLLDHVPPDAGEAP